MNILKRLSIIFILSISFGIHAQQAKDSVKTEVVEVSRSFTPKVQDAHKLDINPEAAQIPEKKIPVKYQIQSIPVASTFSPEKGGMANFNVGVTKSNSYKSYVSLAGGNYVDIEGNAFVYYPVTKKLGSALRLEHYSSQGSKTDEIDYLPYDKTHADVLFNYASDKSEWNMDLGYLARQTQLNLNPNPIVPHTPAVIENKEKLSHNNFLIDLNGRFKESYFKSMKLNYNSYWDIYNNNENKLNFLSKLQFPIGSLNLNMGLQADLVSGDVGKNNQLDMGIDENISYKNMDFGILPAIQIENDNIIFNLGAKIYYQNQDTLYNKIQFMPDVNINLNLIYEKLSIYAGVTGEMKQNSYATHTEKNPYLVANTNILPGRVPYNIYGGINGAFSSAFSYEIKLGYKKINNYAFYISNNMPFANYQMLYDDMSQSYFKTAFNIGVGKKLDLKLKLDYRQNNPDHLQKAINLPDYEFASILDFHPTEKLHFDVILKNIGNRSFTGFDSDILPGFTDLNLGIRYQVNEQFTGFLKGYNLLNNNYQKYYAYPVQKVQILGGIAYKFDIPNNN